VSTIRKPTHPYKVNRETENVVLLAGDLSTESIEWRSRPTEIEFSFNNLCNLKCVMCSKAEDEPNVLLDKDLGIGFLDQILPYALHLTPSANSEPFLNDLSLIYDMAVKHDVMLFLFTNGILCTEERFRKIQPRIHRLWFSFDSHVKETYEAIRAGAHYETVLANIKRTLIIAEEDDTEITFHFVLMRTNLHELPGYVKFIADIGGKQIKVQELLPNSLSYDDLALDGNVPDEEIKAVLDASLDQAKQSNIDLTLALHAPFNGEVRCQPMRNKSKAPMAAFREVYMESFLRIYPFFCNMAANYLKVNPDGGVYPCCRAPDSLLMGDIHKNNFEEIWNGESYQAFRQKMYSRDYPKVCKTCSVLTGNPHFPGI